MSGPSPITGPVTAPVTSAANGTAATPRQQLRKATEGFEAMFVRQILGAARQGSFGGEKDLFGGNPVGGSDDTFTQMRDEKFAEIAAHSGTIGLARQIEAQLARGLNLTDTSAAKGSAATTTPPATEG